MWSLLKRNLTARVLLAILIGIVIGARWPDTGKDLKPLGDTFVNLVRMVIAPLVFVTIVTGIAQMADLRRIGRIGVKAFVWFTLTSVVALAIGLVLVNVFRPGEGIDVAAAAGVDMSRYTSQADAATWLTTLTHVVPASIIDAFARSDILQIVFFAVLFGIALVSLGSRGVPVTDFLERVQEVFFQIVGMIMLVAPIGALGAMAYTVGMFGLEALKPLVKLMGTVYVAMAIFVLIALNLMGRYYGVRVWELLRFIKDEIVLVLGASSSEAALPRLLEKLERYGAAKPIVGLMVPAGYSFNMDGTALYLVMATIFLAQASGVDLSFGQQIGILGLLMITSNGAAGVTGSGFIVLASTLAAVKVIPLEGLALLFGVDRFMSEARAITNFCGNAVAAVVIAKQEGEFDEAKREIAVREASMRPAA
jgi:aerobic C4-dicarboxylate transport protein